MIETSWLQQFFDNYDFWVNNTLIGGIVGTLVSMTLAFLFLVWVHGAIKGDKQDDGMTV